MKRSLFICTVLSVCLLCAAAYALPALTDGETTGWIADNNYLFLQTPSGTIAQLSMPIDDLVRMTDEELICLTGEHLIAVKKNGSGSRILEAAEAEALNNQEPAAEEEQTDESICTETTDGIYVYTVEKAGETYILKVTAVENDGRLIEQQSRDANALALSNRMIATEPLSITVTREALTLTGTDRRVTVMNLLTGETSYHEATGLLTAAACVQNGMLYRYTLTDDQRWVLESGTPVSTPTPTPAPTATPKPTQDTKGGIDEDGTIYYGATGKKVRKIQARLHELGYPVTMIDGIYGDETQLGIDLFSDAIHVREHRYITSKVQDKLYAKNAPVYDPYLPLKAGDEGVSVLFMQKKLKELGYDTGKLDGIYGEKTIAAVALFQAANGMSPGPEDREEPGEVASHELLELLFSIQPGPEPRPVTPTDL